MTWSGARSRVLEAEHLLVQVLAVAGRQRLALGQPEDPLPVGASLRAQEKGIASVSRVAAFR